jgi:pyrroloquinoline quinone (PQQ) biosynthesis protein C
MSFYRSLNEHTQPERDALVRIPIVQACLGGQVSLPSYLAFLQQAYHHVRHTVPLLTYCSERVPQRLHWLRPALEEYSDEEHGHDEWILDDIETCGGDREQARQSEPGFAAEVMVAYAYDTIARGNPVGFFGMVHVLEGTSVALALTAADRIQRGLRLPSRAFSYLRSHGTLDREHTAHLARLLDRLDERDDQAAVIHAARVFYRLYANVFRDLPMPLAASQRMSGAVA